MINDQLEINKLIVRKEYLLSQLKKEYDHQYRNALHFDIIVLANLYCEHKCGIESSFSQKASKIEELDQLIEEKQGVTFWPKWRAARLILKNLLQSGRINTEEQFEKAAVFLTHVESVLAVDETNSRNVEAEYNKEQDENERLVCIAELLHPWIIEHSFEQFRNGHLREAVLNAFIALGDLLREKTGIQLDGAALAAKALSLKDPQIILSELETDSGRNDQIGFMQILQGSFTGIRNPKAHSIYHDLSQHKAVQYLVLASLLARRITEASITEAPN